MNLELQSELETLCRSMLTGIDMLIRSFEAWICAVMTALCTRFTSGGAKLNVCIANIR